MPKSPKGQWRPKGTIPCAMHVGKIATGEIEETTEPPPPDMPLDARRERARRGGLARAKSLTSERKSEIAASGATARWK